MRPAGSQATAWSGRTDAGRGAGRGDPRIARCESLPRRGSSQGLGAVALRRHPQLQATRAPSDAGAWLAGAEPGRAAARAQGPRRHHPHRAGRRHVGHRPDLDHDRRGAGFDLRHGRSLLDGMRRHPRRPPGDPLRGARATAPRCACLLRRFRCGRRRRPRAPPRPRQSVRRRRLPTRAGLSRHQRAHPPSCASPRATAASSASSAR